MERHFIAILLTEFTYYNPERAYSIIKLFLLELFGFGARFGRARAFKHFIQNTPFSCNLEDVCLEFHRKNRLQLNLLTLGQFPWKTDRFRWQSATGVILSERVNNS